MPRVFRRTPQSEEAASYGYRNLLRDVVRKGVEDTKAGVRKKLNPTNSDLLDMAMSMGGMLKVHGTGKLLARLVNETRAWQEADLSQSFPKQIRALREAMRVPEKEWRGLKNIEWMEWPTKPARQGEYSPHLSTIRLKAGGPTKGTVFHEFGHKRQFIPERGSKLSTGVSERQAARTLIDAENMLRSKWMQEGGDFNTFYHSPASVMEEHARVFERKVTSVFDYLTKHPEQAKKFHNWNSLYKMTLEKTLKDAEGMLEMAYDADTLRRLWQSNLRY